MATAQRNNSLLLFGGENATSHYTNTFYQLTQTSSTYDWSTVPQTNTPPGVSYAQAVVANNNNDMYVMGGISNATSVQDTLLQYYKYSFNSQSWTAASTNNLTNATGVPLNRYLFSATYDGANTIYIYGGVTVFTKNILADFYKFDITTGTFTELPNPNLFRYGHTASYLSNGQLVIVGGMVLVNQSGQMNSILAPMNQIMIYDTKSNSWSMKEATANNGTLPSTRSNHNAAVTSDNKIIVFGGDNQATQRNKMYLNAFAILDTSSWSWTVPAVNGIPPARRTLASGAILDGNHLTIAFGEGLNNYYNDVNVLDISTNSWLQSFSTSNSSSSSSLSGGIIAGIVIACVVVALIVLFLLWRFQSYIRWLFMRIHKDIWKPRTGEPLWAETTRIVFQIFLLFIFTVFLVFVIRQAIESPNVTQTIEQGAAEVEVPDIRFCFDGFPSYPETDSRANGIACSTDMGYSCNSFIQTLDMNLFTPVFADSLGAVACYLFRPSSDFVLTGTLGNNNGSRLLFTFFGDTSISYGRIHVSIYPQRMDPNLIVYGLPNNVLMSEADVLNWQTNERNDIQVNNVYDIQPYTYSALSYTLVDHRYLQSDGWNYVGFLPITNSTPEVETTFREESPNPNYTKTHTDLGFFAVYPEKFVTTTKKEVKIYTLVNALGFVGGIFGLLVAIQTWLFGFRPRSPWGVVHRWSVGDMKRSLLRGLQSKFRITNSGIPLVHPVHHRFSMTDLTQIEENETQRITRVEERMQMLEMLFKAYYVDDEVFRSLDDANRTKLLQNNPSHPNETRAPLRSPSSYLDAPKTEKVVDDGFAGSKPASFTRHDTDVSSASHIPLTQRNYQHAPPYQPGTTVQMHDDDDL
ncbi:hypothetical protein G6F47_006263 [Rhizopus delemar]|nr:hypothetical protein G6F49_006071 [Rhizopus delemar]KAG1586952.1 hypothetical protein G6F48_006257 [Rhizopus delemar]KAG1598616.1 hypothetical protein G6F47_006263 [Rhizopus delemar]